MLDASRLKLHRSSLLHDVTQFPHSSFVASLFLPVLPWSSPVLPVSNSQVLVASFPVLPCFFPAPPLYFHGPSTFLSGPSLLLLVPLLFSPAWRPRRPPAASIFPCFPRLLPCFLTNFCVFSLLCFRSVLLSSSNLVLPCYPHADSMVLSQPSWFPPCSPFSFPVLSCLVASAASGRLDLSLLSPASSLFPHYSSVFPHCSACPLCFSPLLTWSFPVLLMVLQWSFPSLAGSLPVRPGFFSTLYCHFFVLLCFMAIVLLPCSFQVLLTPCLVKSC